MSFLNFIFKKHQASFLKKKAQEKKEALKPRKEEDRWFQSEGKLAIDLYKTGSDLVLRSTIAGVKPEDLEITIQGDIIEIKGVRSMPQDLGEKNYFIKECYWGPFSRQVILPEEVDPSRAQANLKDGILTIKVPALELNKQRKLEVKE